MARLDKDQMAIRRINFVGGKTFAVSMPVDIIRLLKWDKGDRVMVRRQGQKVVIEKISEDQ